MIAQIDAETNVCRISSDDALFKTEQVTDVIRYVDRALKFSTFSGDSSYFKVRPVATNISPALKVRGVRCTSIEGKPPYLEY